MHTITDPLFADAISGVAPLKTEPEVRLSAPTPTPESLHKRRLAAIQIRSIDSNPLSTLAPIPVEAFEILSFRRPGLAMGVAKALRLGQIPCPHGLDLHHCSVEQARLDVYDFIAEAQARGLRCVRIIHGRGALATPQAVLKSFVNSWLRELPEVMAFHSAQKRHGGTGAVYVLLRQVHTPD